MDKLDKFLRPALAKKGLLKAATSAEICYFAAKWQKIPCKVISFTSGILKVSVDSSAAASELEICKHELIDFINEKHENAVKNVRIYVI